MRKRPGVLRELRRLQGAHVGDAFQSDLGEGFDDPGGETKRGEGERRDRVQSLARGNDCLLAIPRHPPCTSDRIGNRSARLQALSSEPPHQIVGKRFLAAEQMSAARNIEGEPVGRIEPDQRRVAIAPVGGRFEQHEIGLLVRIRDGKLRIHRARVRERHACAQAARHRGVVDGRKP